MQYQSYCNKNTDFNYTTSNENNPYCNTIAIVTNIYIYFILENTRKLIL